MIDLGHNCRLESSLARLQPDPLERLCAGMGVNYLAGRANEDAKAGNLNNGRKHSAGELVAVFDADHAPARDFLSETVGYFSEDEKLFLVQTPHLFINPDPLERNFRTFERMPSENEMFYGIIQRGLDKWNASFFLETILLLDERDGYAPVQNNLLALRGFAYLKLRRLVEAKRIFEAAAATGRPDAVRGLAKVQAILNGVNRQAVVPRTPQVKA